MEQPHRQPAGPEEGDAPGTGAQGPGLLGRFAMVRRDEWPLVAWSAAYFFFVLGGYYLLRPVRETMGIERGADDLPWLMTGTMGAMLLANPAYSWLASTFPRRRFIPITYRAFALCLLLFAALLWWSPEGRRLGVGYAFYIWLSVFNLFAVSVFWALMADVFSREQGKRLFALIGVGGTIGGIAGPAAAKEVVALGAARDWEGPGAPVVLMLMAVGALEAAVFCARAVMRRGGIGATPAGASGPDGSAHAAPHGRGGEPGPGVWTGMALVARSPYLLLICVHLFLYALLSTFLYLEQGRIVSGAITDRGERTALFASIDLWVNVLTLGIQLLLGGRILTYLGVGPTLALIPLVSALGFAALWGGPLVGVAPLTVLVAFQVTRRGLHYAVSQPGRQVLFTVVSQDARYKSKAFIDTFVYRGGDLVGAWTPRALLAAAARAGVAASAAVPMVAVPLGALGVGVALILGRMLRRGRAGAAGMP